MDASLFERRTRIPVDARDMRAWHFRPGAFSRLNPPWENAKVIRSPGELTDGAIAEIEVGMGPLTRQWVAEHEITEDGFIDRQLAGPFSSWEHRHTFLPHGESSELIDSIRYRLPLGLLGRFFGKGLVERKLDRMFRYRHEVTMQDLSRTRENPPPGSLAILLTGATGVIGSALCGFLETQGHTVHRVTRSPRNESDIGWDLRKGTIDLPTGVRWDAVIHLAGANVADGRWTAKKKEEILESRRRGTRLLSDSIARLPSPPSVLVSASGSGYYPIDGKAHTESSPRGDHFLSDVCEVWESETESAKQAGIRVVHPRIGMVLTPRGGALRKLLPVFSSGFGGVLGRGERKLSWIGIDDVLDILHRATWESDWEGALNVTSPNPCTHREFYTTLARVLRRPCLLPVPDTLIRGVFGEMADETVLADLAVVPEKLQDLGYRFRHPDLTGALCHLLGKQITRH